MKAEQREQVAMNLERMNNWDELFRQLHSKLSGFDLSEVRELKITASGFEITHMKKVEQ